MRKLLLALAVLAWGCSEPPPPGRAQALLGHGAVAPDVRFQDLDGGDLALSSLRGKTVVLNFWFRDCPPCREEMPKLSEFSAEIREKRQDVEFLSVNRGDSTEVIRSWWLNGTFRHRAVQQQGDEVSAAFGVSTYPTNIVIGPDGKIIFSGVGWEPAMIRGALATTAR